MSDRMGERMIFLMQEYERGRRARVIVGTT
jgi:hypothetical protein